MVALPMILHETATYEGFFCLGAMWFKKKKQDGMCSFSGGDASVEAC